MRGANDEVKAGAACRMSMQLYANTQHARPSTQPQPTNSHNMSLPVIPG